MPGNMYGIKPVLTGRAELENVPVALWGKPLDGAVKVDEDGFVRTALTGVSVAFE